MTYFEAKKRAISILLEAGIEAAKTDAVYLLEEASGLDRSVLFARLNEELPLECENRFFELVERRRSREPLQYIIGNAVFMGYTFLVTPDVLIPRLDTEMLASLAIMEIDQAYRGMAGSFDEFRILDLCTGSGCVAISLGLMTVERLSRPRDEGTLKNGISVIGADISSSALKVAQRNLELNWPRVKNLKFVSEDAGLKISFCESDLFNGINGKFHIITANPPYIVRDEINTLMPEITEHEPYLALDGGEDGMDFYRRIVKEAPDYLYAGGRLIMELDDMEAEPVKEMLTEAGFKDVKICVDLAGLKRVIEGRI